MKLVSFIRFEMFRENTKFKDIYLKQLIVLGFSLILCSASASVLSANKPLIKVPVEIMQTVAVRIWKTFSGRLVAVDYVEIKPRVSGAIIDVRFKDGQSVKKGDVLYVINPRPYRAAVNHAKAELALAKTVAKHAEKESKRVTKLFQSKLISQLLYDELINKAHSSKGSVAVAEARLEQAQISLDYAYIKAPISGRISWSEITQGNLVQAGVEAPVLTTLISNQGIYADFEVDEQTYLSHVHSVADNRLDENKIPVELSLKGNKIRHQGFIYSFDNRIDASSGTIRGRAYFPNKDKSLLAGMFVNIKVGSVESKQKMLINEAAVGTNQDRKFVYVVNKVNQVEYREISISESITGRRVVNDGLKNGDKVIIEGLMRIKPGMEVDPQVNQKSLVSH